MARLPRLTWPGLVHHVVWCGHNRQAVFLDDADRQVFLDTLADVARREAVQVHAWVLLDDALHLLLTPTREGGLSRLMQSLGRSYVRHFNQRHGRSGTLWEGRYRCTVLQAETYLMATMVYLDLSPVRAGLAPAPEAYRWSSHAHYVGQRNDRWLIPHPLVWALGNTPFAREAAYADMVRRGLSGAQWHTLTDAALKGWALGDATFLAALGQQTGRRLSRGKPGRPPSAKKAESVG